MFRETLEKLQGDSVCQKMSLNSFLLLPMQRVTRLPLLLAAILKHSPLDQPHLWQMQAALAAAYSVREGGPESCNVYLLLTLVHTSFNESISCDV